MKFYFKHQNQRIYAKITKNTKLKRQNKTQQLMLIIISLHLFAKSALKQRKKNYLISIQRFT